MIRANGVLIDISPLRTSRPFRYAFSARLVSLLGIGLLLVALPVQVYRLTESSLHVAAVATTMSIALFGGSLFGGVIADRLDRRRVIQWARTAAGLGFVVLGCNALLPDPLLWPIYAAAVVDGLAGGVSGSALMALTPLLVGREKLAAAGALIALTTDLGTMVTPAVAGVVIAEFGLAPAYFAAALATSLTVGLFRAVGAAPPPEGIRENPVLALLTGIRFAVRHSIIRAVLATGLLAMLISGPMVLLPSFVDIELGAGPTTLGLLYAAPAVGAVIGALTSGWTGRTTRPGTVLLAALVLMPVGLVLLGVAETVLPALLGLAGFGLMRAVNDILRFALLQEHAPEDLRGRLSGLMMMQAVTGTAVGSMTAGVLGHFFSPGTALAVYGAAGTVLGLAMFAGLRSLHTNTKEAAMTVEECNVEESNVEENNTGVR